MSKESTIAAMTKEGEELWNGSDRMIDKRQCKCLFLHRGYDISMVDSMYYYMIRKHNIENCNMIPLENFKLWITMLRGKKTAKKVKTKVVEVVPTNSDLKIELPPEARAFFIKLAQKKDKTLVQVLTQVILKFKADLEQQALDLADL